MGKVKIKFAGDTGFIRIWLVLSAFWIFGHIGLVIDFGSRALRKQARGTFIPVALLDVLGTVTVGMVEGPTKSDR
jgi:hypothetical protein